jgi:hypothetical protein
MISLDSRMENYASDLRQIIDNRGRPGNIPVERLDLFEDNGWAVKYIIRGKPFYVVNGDVFHKVSSD